MELFKAIDFIAIFQILVFIVVLARHKQLKREHKVFLILFLISILYLLLDRIQYFYRHELNALQFPHLYQSGEPFWYLLLPLLFLYIKSVTTINFKLKWIQLIHAIPFFIVLTYVLANYTFLPTNVKYEALKDGATIYNPPHKLAFFNNLLFFQKGYQLACFYLVYRYQKNMKHYVSTINWYNVAPLYFALFAFLSMFLIRLILPPFFTSNFQIPIDIDLALYAIVIIILGYKQAQLFLNPPTFLEEKPQEKDKSGLKEHINTFMDEEKPFLDPELTLESFARKLEINPRKLSQVLNTELKSNFFTYINQYRVAEAKIRLRSPEHMQKTVLEILYEVGFNNKSAFNRVFKEYTQHTPSQYRKLKS